MSKDIVCTLIFTNVIQLSLYMSSSPQVFWDSINKGYSLIRFKQFKQIFRIVNDLKIPQRTNDEINAVLALEAWAATFAGMKSHVRLVSSKLIETINGDMPAWYRGVGYLNLALIYLNKTCENRFTFFSEAANAYELHLQTEIPLISKPPYSALNRAITMLFKGICALEADGSKDVLENLLTKTKTTNHLDIDLTLQNIFRATKLQLKGSNYTPEILDTAKNLVNDGVDPLFLCNIILQKP